jgi:hypothetical protein
MLVFVLSGCEWTNTRDAGAWNDSYAWLDFSGVYRDPNNGPLVGGVTFHPGSTATDVLQQDPVGFTGAAPGLNYSGRTGHAPVLIGSFALRIGSITIVEAPAPAPAGSLVQAGAIGTSGTINYQTGVWSVQLAGAPPPNTAIIATYRYNVSATTGTVDPGNTGLPVYNLTVNQTGNRLTMTDNRGMTYSGQITGVAAPENPASVGVSTVNMVFEASGNGIRIVGSFSGTWTVTASTGGAGGAAAAPSIGQLANRVIQGTWVENNVQGQIYGVSGTIALTAPVVVTPTSLP